MGKLIPLQLLPKMQALTRTHERSWFGLHSQQRRKIAARPERTIEPLAEYFSEALVIASQSSSFLHWLLVPGRQSWQSSTNPGEIGQRGSGSVEITKGL